MSHDWTRDVNWDHVYSPANSGASAFTPEAAEQVLEIRQQRGHTPDGERSRRKWAARAARADREWVHVGPNPEALRKFATRCVRPGCGHLSTEHVVRHVSDHCKACHCPGYVKGSIFGSHFR